mgnify:CR=1 FL=1
MRSHGGGWHANTAKVCFGLSIIYYLTVVFVSERLPDTFDNLRFMALISAIIILLSPVDSINKPLDSEQRKIEKKKTCNLQHLTNLKVEFFDMLCERNQFCLVYSTLFHDFWNSQ